MMKKIQIALDGPAGAGKSTIAKQLAARLDYVYIDTGAMYRAVTLAALEQSLDLNNGEALGELMKSLDIRLTPGENGQRVFIGDREVTDAIRSIEITNNVSFVARQKEVRAALVTAQRKLAERGGIVMDGRDIGTVVLPDAELKVFLTATVEERAARRHRENIARGMDSDITILQEEIALRDKRDSEREVSPLRQADDALYLDTTEMTIDEVVVRLMELAEGVLK
ncbi:cytidylate kinase [Exiguobacterium sp. Leaf187]|uniref:Cytidylate kinase n=1 Tax=Exiguobacterium indicum TaxID=296995 RepID=A0A0V8GK89_9BACL|nr:MULTISPECIES: (d)CMP kinase [Exiguobacterium]AHA30039.1 cytidylate kinase [Exiguobacterium sp. MH3]KQS19282.1 cytidylate kinase [Exiguobacterium sp. Leaf187]KSU50707.1 cytidylate kinase [Exiguobacterium enclense]KTR26553.1 cytidylate kinase [Exiguobacterium indicum]MCQ4089956.1 (d)CMP kinase [Exiguobacterium sp. LL15]